MKRYDLTLYFDDFERPTAIVGQKSQGRYVCAADLQAWALKLKEVVEGMEHGHACDARYCQVCGRTDYAGCGTITKHERRTGKCTCGKSEALRLLGEVFDPHA